MALAGNHSSISTFMTSDLFLHFLLLSGSLNMRSQFLFNIFNGYCATYCGPTKRYDGQGGYDGGY